MAKINLGLRPKETLFMREFNTSGPCNPALHYTVMREALILQNW